MQTILFSLTTLSIFYLEMVLLLSTGCDMWNKFIVYVLFFSLSYGIVGSLLSRLTKKPLANKIIMVSYLALTGLLYTVNYFIYAKFKVFYDFNTVIGGAGGAVGEFSGDIFKMIFSGNGILRIFLFFLPTILYAVIGWRWDAAERFSWKRLLLFAEAAALSFLIAWVSVTFTPADEDAYTDEFHYSMAVEKFGMATSIRLEVKNLLLGRSDNLDFGDVFEDWEDLDDSDDPGASAEDPGVTATPTPDPDPTEGPIETPEPTPTPIVYERNEQDIDFQTLAEGASKDLANLDKYVNSLTGSMQHEFTGLFEGKNLIMITAEAFTAEVIDEVRTPALYRMATKGIQFTDFYAPATAGTTGGEYSVLMGMLPSAGGKSMKNTATQLNYMTMGYQLNLLGYFGKAYHNNSYTFYDRHLTHVNLGYSDGYLAKGNGLEASLSSGWPASDLEMIQATLPEYIEKEKFNIYYMSVSGHSLYGPTSNKMTKKNWDVVKDLPYSDPVKSYLGCQQELENAMAYLIGELEARGLADDTVICIATDHFPYGLDENYASGDMPYLTELYGKEVTNILERDHNRLIIWSGALEKMDPIVVDEPTFTPDILPTLLNLFGVDFDSRLLPGRDALSDAQPLIYTLGYDWKTDLGTYIAKTGTFVPKDASVEIPEGYVKAIKTIVKNKITYSKGVLNTDYFRHIYGE